MKKAFTLIEMIFVVVISGILAIGTFKAFEALYIRSAKAKAITELSLQSQVVLDQLGVILYNRIPNSVIGYDGSNSASCTPIDEIVAADNSRVLEWLALDDEQLLNGYYSGFVDMNSSSKPNLVALGVTTDLNISNRDLIFAGAFDDGSENIPTCSGAYGWHGNDSNLSHGINSSSTDSIILDDTLLDPAPDFIYAKYYLANGAYAVTRGEHVDNIANCGINESDFKDFNNVLFLFYNFYPYRGETYCGDGGAGDVSVLAEDVLGFRATYENDSIRLSIDMQKDIRGSTQVHISKQKAIF